MPKTLTAADIADLIDAARDVVDDAWRYDDDAENDGPWSLPPDTYNALSDLVAKLTQE